MTMKRFTNRSKKESKPYDMIPSFGGGGPTRSFCRFYFLIFYILIIFINILHLYFSTRYRVLNIFKLLVYKYNKFHYTPLVCTEVETQYQELSTNILTADDRRIIRRNSNFSSVSF